MVLGLSHPRGPLEWADAIGLEHVLAVLEALCDEYREERYRPAPALRRLVARRDARARAAGAGFFDYALTRPGAADARPRTPDLHIARRAGV